MYFGYPLDLHGSLIRLLDNLNELSECSFNYSLPLNVHKYIDLFFNIEYVSSSHLFSATSHRVKLIVSVFDPSVFLSSTA